MEDVEKLLKSSMEEIERVLGVLNELDKNN